MYTSGKWRYQIADYQSRHPERRPLGLADLRRPEAAAGRRQRLLQHALGSDLLGRRADDRLGSPRLDAGPSGTESTARPGTRVANVHAGRCADRRDRHCRAAAAGARRRPPRRKPARADAGNQQVAQRPIGPAAGRQCSGDPPAGQSGDGLSMAGRHDEQSGRAADRAAAVLAARIDHHGRRPSGTYTFTFQAVQPGTGSIRLYYVRPNDPSRPRDSFAVGVNVSPASQPPPPGPLPTAASRANEHDTNPKR